MRLLLVHQGWPDDDAPGGSELHVAELAKGLAGRGHEVAVLARERNLAVPDGALRETRDDAGLRVWRMNNAQRHARELGASDPAAEHGLRQVLDTWRPDLVHAHHVGGFGARGLHRVRGRGIALAITMHDHWASCLLGQLLDRDLRPCPGPAPARCATCLAGPLARPLVRALAPAAMAVFGALRRPFERRQEAMHGLLLAADVLIAPSLWFARKLAALGFPEPRVVPLGSLATANAHRAARAHGAALRVGFVGSVIPSKGVHVLVDAMARLAPDAFTLRIHGPAPAYHGDTGYAARLRAALGPRVEALSGSFPAARLASLLEQLDVLVLPSLWEENAPRVLDEAFRFRCVPVVSGHGSLAVAVRDGVDGLHFVPGDAASLAAALRRLHAEPALLERLAAAARRPPTQDAMLDDLEAAYAEARERFDTRVGRVGVVVLDRGAPERTARAVASVLGSDPEPTVLVVHNGPGPEGDLPAGAERLRLDRNGGFARGMNAGLFELRNRGCDRVLLLNNDARLESGALRALAEAVGEGAAAAASPIVLRAADGRVESTGLTLGPALLRPRLRQHGAPAGAARASAAAEALSGVALMLFLPALARVGALREDYFHGFEDVDLSLRLRAAGLGLTVVGAAFCAHEGAATLGTASPLRHYYAARNHVRAAETLRALPTPLLGLRRLWLLALGLAHAARQRQVPRVAALRSTARGARDGWAGVTGEACAS